MIKREEKKHNETQREQKEKKTRKKLIHNTKRAKEL